MGCSMIPGKENATSAFARSKHAVEWILILLSCSLWAQAQTNQISVSPNFGSVPSGPATNGVVRLSLRDAIRMALRYNLGQIESNENIRIARGRRLQVLSALLPHVNAGVSETVQQLSASTLGIKNPLIPPVIGPFAYSTVQANINLTLFSYESIQRLQAAGTAEAAAQLSYSDTLDAVTLIVGNAYLQVIDTNSRIVAREAQVRNAQALYDQAVEELRAGTSPKIDVTRTGVQLHTEQYNLSVARNNFEIAKLNLARAIGLPLGQAFEITDQLPYADLNPQNLDEALKSAYQSRSDFQAALRLEKTAQQQLSAVRGERYPVVAVNGNYGVQGATFGHSHGTFLFEGGLQVPVFTGRRIEGDITQAEAALRQRKAEAENVRGQVDYDVRKAYLDLQAAKDQVFVAHQNVDLANESLARSKERFAAGVTDSVEVVQAQQALASANDQYISSLYSHNLSKLQLARALGVVQSSYNKYLAIP